jgi:type IV pilus assembly protein PilQ
MDEKKLSGLFVTMNRFSGTYRVICVFTFIAAILTACSVFFAAALPASAANRLEIPPGLTMGSPAGIRPVIGAIQVSQIGGTALNVRVRGYDLPTPRIVSPPGEAKLVIQWDGARFPQSTDKNDWWSDYSWDVLEFGSSSTNSWWKQYNLPLLNRVNAEPVDAESVRLTFITNQPMVLEAVNGIAGADEIVIRLKVFEPDKAPAPMERPKPLVKGDPAGITTPVTFQMRDADLKNVLRAIADMQKLDILLDSSVPDMPITFSFNGLPYNEAFRYLLNAGGLAYKVEKGLLVVSTPERIGKNLGTEVTKTYRLSYATDDNGQVRSEITGALTGLVPLSTPPTLDTRNRELYVTATEETHSEVAEVLNQLDKPGRQVMLEARIFEVSNNGTQDLETLMTAIYNHWVASFSRSGLSAGYNYSNQGWENDSWSLPIGGSVGGSPVLETWPIEGTRLLSVGLRAIEQKGYGRNLANPSLITIDGQQADIDLSRSVSYVSGVDSNGNPSISQISYGPHLSFLPTIGRDGIVSIKINIQAGDLIQFRPAGMGAQTPETSNRSVQTTVRVRNGEPFVVGGLFQDIKTQNRSRIPVLGYIPLLGDLFTMKNDVHNKSEVAIIVIPHILDVPNDSIETLQMRKLSKLK